jgi:hypothetical protein
VHNGIGVATFIDKSLPTNNEAISLTFPPPTGAASTTTPSPATRTAAIAGRSIFVLGCVLFLLLPFQFLVMHHWEANDFMTVYSSARCLLTGCDPYSDVQIKQAFFAKNPNDAQREFFTDNAAADTAYVENGWSWQTYNANYPVSSLAFVAPFALLTYKYAFLLWYLVNAALFLLAAYECLRICAPYSSIVIPILLTMLLVVSDVLLVYGQPSCAAIALCALGAYCLIIRKMRWTGILALAISLVLKPQIGGLIWLYFLLDGKEYRRKALTVAAVALVLALIGIGIAEMHPASVHWLTSLSTNLKGIAATGRPSDPGRANRDSESIVNLQVLAGAFTDNPTTQNHFSWAISGILLALWGWITLRAKSSMQKDLFGLASIACLSLLPIYHRNYDVPMLILAFPALALMLSKGGARAATGAISVAIAILLASRTLFLTHHWRLLLFFTDQYTVSKTKLLLFFHPLPIMLLFVACFFLAQYARLLRPQPDNIEASHQ